ncbi:vanadium-dependent haloperoxidase [Falsiroseomonas selenitidurans]|uniref:Vanadium-dependent haloperoxidase n=1 Tax=Falsiroseomonas selenitidurans TaxID=2716335 RepID=A0ABX1EDA9_9PROT|nr:vanadium-dependent haloperoxidase [Falsiroseomonas selenitidurans]NKC33882.1 vanadium-dependent haloperoxidase [Falsiroseomonas selenitidurans]
MPQMAVPRAPLPDASTGSVVMRWMLVTDRLSLGVANPQVMAAVAMAMHDALNAVQLRYRRWQAPAADEPPATGASPDVALSMAAFRVLASVSPIQQLRAEAEPLLLEVLRAAEPRGRQAGEVLGSAIGAAMAVRLADPPRIAPLPEGTGPGQWRPTPPFFRNGMIADIPPILFERRDGVRGAGPPALDSPRYLADLGEVRQWGALDSASRSAAQSEAAEFWAGQSGHRGFLHLALRLLREHAGAEGAWTEARVVSVLTTALADASNLAWEEKRAHAFWRPITAIQTGSPGMAADPTWQPFIFTPPHPDYPSGHAADCAAGAAVLQALLGTRVHEVVYVAMEPVSQPSRRFPSFEAAASECADSRVWAGAHFRFSNEEGQRIGRAVAARALERVQAQDNKAR